jgi:5'(3')-deoxyribonucleotidase
MKRPKIASIDVDEVVVSLYDDWVRYLCARSSVTPNPEHLAGYYNIGKAFPDLSDVEIRAFWKQRGLYDTSEPLEGAVEGIQMFITAGYDIVFASHVEGDHGKSKFEFLNRFFPFNSFAQTREKGYLQPDIAIDDRLSHLQHYNYCKPTCVTVQFDTPFDQDGCEFFPDFKLKGWTDTSMIEKIIMIADEAYERETERLTIVKGR